MHPVPSPNRWLILAGGILVQLAIGGVYAWSVFAKALSAPESALRLAPVQASLPFQIAIGLIFVGAMVGGRLQDRHGPRAVALAGIAVYAAGIMLSSAATAPGDLWLLVLGYGVLGGFGLGLAYIVPIAMLQKWFPDRAGLVTGLAVGGFGFGAVLTSPVAGALIAADPSRPTSAFLPLGLAYLVAGLAGAATFANPPAGEPDGGGVRSPSASHAAPGRDFTAREALATPQWYLLTLILTVAVTAGISLVSVAADAATEITGMSVTGAAALVGALGLANGGGRILWAWVSDRAGKMRTFAVLFAILAAALLALPHAGSPAMFVLLAAVIYTCYGGAFGIMPSTAGKFFGVTHAGAIYGPMLIGWSIGGVMGPLLVAGLAGSGERNYVLAFSVMGIIAAAGTLLPLATRPPSRRT